MAVFTPCRYPPSLFKATHCCTEWTVVDLTDEQKTEDLLHDSLANWYSLVHKRSRYHHDRRIARPYFFRQ
jgi:hypothetical protein